MLYVAILWRRIYRIKPASKIRLKILHYILIKFIKFIGFKYCTINEENLSREKRELLIKFLISDFLDLNCINYSDTSQVRTKIICQPESFWQPAFNKNISSADSFEWSIWPKCWCSTYLGSVDIIPSIHAFFLGLAAVLLCQSLMELQLSRKT